MQTDEKGWNDCTHVFHPSGAKYQPFRKRNDFWNDLQDAPFKQPFQVERLAQEDHTFGVFLGSDSTPFRSTSSPIGELWNGFDHRFGPRGTRWSNRVCTVAVVVAFCPATAAVGKRLRLGDCRARGFGHLQ
jgi:hypothetical protein